MTKNQLEVWTSIVDFLGETLGPDYEVVLQDLSEKQNCVVAIANGEISGRTIGSPITDAALNHLKQKLYVDNDYISNYKGMTTDGQILRSSTFFIKDKKGEPYALLCINFSDKRYIEVHDKLLELAHPLSFLLNHSTHTIMAENMPDTLHPISSAPAHTSVTETFISDVNALMASMFNEVVAQSDVPTDRMTQAEKIKVVQLLDEQGMFKLKGAVPYVAKQFGCSNASVYRYLSEAR